MIAERITFGWDENGLHMTVTDEDGHHLDFLVRDDLATVLAEARAAIQPWLDERNEARAEYDANLRAGQRWDSEARDWVDES